MAHRKGCTIELFRPATWRRKVRKVVDEFMPLAVLRRLNRVSGDDIHEDTLEYLERAYRRAGYSFDLPTRENLCEAVLNQFAFVRGYHGCRISNFESYRQDGLLPLTRERLALMAYEIFAGRISFEELKSKAREANLATREGNIYFCADLNDLVSQCGHYLIYGPEALCCLWNSGDPQDYRRYHESKQLARSFGIPTVLTCDVPISWLIAEYRSELVRTLITWHLALESNRPVGLKHRSRNCAFGIRQTLPPEYIRNHIHPKTIPDPIFRYNTYENPQTKCEWCLDPRFGPKVHNNRRGMGLGSS